MKGQYGPYIKYKTINATIPDDKDPENISQNIEIHKIQLEVKI